MKEQQKQRIIDIMKLDEELGMYHDFNEVETLEYHIESLLRSSKHEETLHFATMIREGARWQAEKMYSDMQKYAEFCVECDRAGLKLIVAKDWYTQFKNNK